MRFLTLFHEGFDALVGLQKISQGFTQIAVIILSESRQDAVALFVKIDLPPDHEARLAQQHWLNTIQQSPHRVFYPQTIQSQCLATVTK